MTEKIPYVKKHLSFENLISTLRDHFSSIEDKRNPLKVKYEIVDVLMSGLAMMFFQDASLLAFQRRWEEASQASNLQTVFGLTKTPSDTQFRDLLDGIPSGELSDPFEKFLSLTQRSKILKNFEFLYDRYIIALDGTQYFSSDTIHCECCLEKKREGKPTNYSHSVLQAAIVHPDIRKILPLFPEQISNTDGKEKQDCETNAAKRWIVNFRKKHPKIKAFITGDGLYSHIPFIEQLQILDFSFLLVAKPGDHKYLFKMIESSDEMGKVNQFEVSDKKNNLYIYRWKNEVKLNGESNIKINYFQFEIFNNDKDKITYPNSWVTDILISEDNVVDLVRGARARWKIENEGFNTLKNHGYEIEHNYGHGKENLCFNFYLLNLLAFFMHQIFEISCRLYAKARLKFTARIEYWNTLRAIFRILNFENWNEMLTLIIGKTHPS